MSTTNPNDPHVIIGPGQTPWHYFAGEVPRVGEIVDVPETNCRWIVRHVVWFTFRYTTSPIAHDGQPAGWSSARVFVEPHEVDLSKWGSGFKEGE